MSCSISSLFSRISQGPKSKMSAWSWTAPCRCLDGILLTPEISILSELFSFLREKSPFLLHSSSIAAIDGQSPYFLLQIRFPFLTAEHGPRWNWYPTGPKPRPPCICCRSWIAHEPDHLRPSALQFDFVSHYAPSEPIPHYFFLFFSPCALPTPPHVLIFPFLCILSLSQHPTSPLFMHSAGVSWLSCPRCIPPMLFLFSFLPCYTALLP